MSKNILEEALRIVDGDRGKFYGHPLDNHGNTAEFWASYLKRKFGVEINLTGRDVCLMMVLLKISRDANRPKEDNLLDICGYTRNVQMIEEEEESRALKDTPFAPSPSPHALKAKPPVRKDVVCAPPLGDAREIERPGIPGDVREVELGGGKPELAE